jgi:type VI protein secretion system component VasF
MRRNIRKSNQKFMWGVMVMAMVVLVLVYLFLSASLPQK